MTPVCPACRASLFLDAYACWRCGLSVRPTCARCGEPLTHGMEACWFCREPITEPESAQDMAVVRAAAASASRPVVVAAAAPSPPPPAPEPEPVTAPVNVAPRAAVHPVAVAVADPLRRSRRVRWGRAVVLGIVFGVLLTAGALAYESVWIRYLPPPPERIALSRASYSDLGCAVARPAGWAVQETKRRVTFLGGESAKDRSTRGFRVSATDIPYDRADDQVAELADRLGSYEPLDTVRREVDGERALVHTFIADDLRFEQWWIDRGKRTLRIDLWSRPADDDAPALNERIVRSIELL